MCLVRYIYRDSISRHEFLYHQKSTKHKLQAMTRLKHQCTFGGLRLRLAYAMPDNCHVLRLAMRLQSRRGSWRHTRALEIRHSSLGCRVPSGDIALFPPGQFSDTIETLVMADIGIPHREHSGQEKGVQGHRREKLSSAICHRNHQVHACND